MDFLAEVRTLSVPSSTERLVLVHFDHDACTLAWEPISMMPDSTFYLNGHLRDDGAFFVAGYRDLPVGGPIAFLSNLPPDHLNCLDEEVWDWASEVLETTTCSSSSLSIVTHGSSNFYSYSAFTTIQLLTITNSPMVPF